MSHRNRRYALVAGGAGFIGSHLVESLIGDGWAVDVLDDFSTGRTDNLRHLLNVSIDDDEKLLSVQRGDVIALKADPARDDGRTMSRYDVVYNLACPASPKAYQADGVGTIMTNVMGTHNMLELARAHEATFVQASTSEVYGDPLEHPQNELYWGNVNPFGERACYDEGKRCAEALCYEFKRKSLTPSKVRVARIFNTYGPRMDPFDGRVVSTFIRQAILDEPLTVFGDGSQTRSFCFVSDMVKGLRALAAATTADFPTPINLGNDAEFKVSELAEALTEWFPRVTVVNEPLPPDDPKLRKPDLRQARLNLGYEPRVPLREGLAQTVEWMRARLA